MKYNPTTHENLYSRARARFRSEYYFFNFFIHDPHDDDDDGLLRQVMRARSLVY